MIGTRLTIKDLLDILSVTMREKTRNEGLNNSDLLSSNRIAIAVSDLIKTGLVKKGELFVKTKKTEIRDGNHTAQQCSVEVIVAPFPGVEFIRGAISVMVPSKNSRFRMGEKRISNSCLLQGTDEEGKVISIGFTTHVLGSTSKNARISYIVQRERRKPVRWTEGAPSPLAISEQQRIAKAVGLPTF